MSSATPAEAVPAVDPDGRPIAVSHRQGRREATGDHGFGMDMGLLARVAQLVVGTVVLIILAGTLLMVLKANPSNSIVADVHSWARSFAGQFDGMFSFHSANDAIAVNWGIATVVYLLVGGLIVRSAAPTVSAYSRVRI
jgi:hypothetical protein